MTAEVVGIIVAIAVGLTFAAFLWDALGGD